MCISRLCTAAWLRRPLEMTTCVRFYLSYDCLKWDFIALKVDIISIENITLDGIMTLRSSNQVLCNVWSYDFYEMKLATE